MKNIKILMAMLIPTLILGGCRPDTENNNITELSEIKILSNNLELSNTEYDFNHDSQNYFDVQSGNLAATSDGYYFFYLDEGSVHWLSFFDRTSMKVLPVCQRADCTHDNADCDAYFEGTDTGLSITDGRIWYYDGRLYYNSLNSQDGYATYSLYSVSPDGSTREKVCELCSLKYDGSGLTDIPEIILHRGYIYYACSDGNTSYLYRISLDGDGSSEELCRCSGYYSGIYNIQGYGNGIVFQCFYYTDGAGADSDIRQMVFYYNQEDETISLLINDNSGLCAVANDCILYSDGRNMNSYSLTDFTSHIFVRNTAAIPSYDGRYIYFDNIWSCDNDIIDISNRKIDVYDLNKNLIDTISLSGNELNSDFGDKYYLFQEYMDENYNFTLFALDKSQIGTGNHEWIEIK